MTKIAAIIAVVVSASTAQAMPPAGQAAQPGWAQRAPDSHVVPRNAQAGQAAQPASWIARQSARTHVYANAGVAHGQAAQPGWSVRQ